jgi:hypothetical protein
LEILAAEGTDLVFRCGIGFDPGLEFGLLLWIHGKASLVPPMVIEAFQSPVVVAGGPPLTDAS